MNSPQIERPLRFCFLTTFYPPYNFGGDGIVIERLARGLVSHGHHVTVVHDVDAFRMLHKGPEPNVPESTDGIEVIRLHSWLGSFSCLLTQQIGRPVVNGARIREILDRGNFDVVNFHNISLIGGPGILSYGADSLRLYMAHEHWLVCPTHVLWRHGRELCTERQCTRCVIRHKRLPQVWRATGYLDRQLALIDTFIAMSEFSRDKHHEFGFTHEMEVFDSFLPDPITETESDVSGPPHERPYFLFVGRLEKIKGLDDVIPLFRDYPDADLLIAGEGEYSKTLRTMARGMEQVRFLGRIPQDELHRYYAHAVALIVPSVCFETFGIIIIESLQHGTPVIARRLGPFPEILARSGGGELFSDEAGLVSSMRRLQHDVEYRQALAKAGKAAFRRHWVESASVPRYLDIVHRTAKRKNRMDLVAALARA